jgi:hypothetical protein
MQFGRFNNIYRKSGFGLHQSRNCFSPLRIALINCVDQGARISEPSRELKRRWERERGVLQRRVAAASGHHLGARPGPTWTARVPG